MNKLAKKILVATMAAVMALGSVTTAFAAGSPSDVVIGSDYVSSVNSPASDGSTVKTSEAGYAAVTEVEKTTKKSLTISSTVTVTVNGETATYKVHRVAANAFSENTQLTKITLPSSINVISKNAFAGLKNLKTINLNVKKNITVKKGAFGKVNTKNITIKVSKNTSSKELKKLQKTFKAAGFKGTVKKAS
jgi:hypothetical protein